MRQSPRKATPEVTGRLSLAEANLTLPPGDVEAVECHDAVTVVSEAPAENFSANSPVTPEYDFKQIPSLIPYPVEVEIRRHERPFPVFRSTPVTSLPADCLASKDIVAFLQALPAEDGEQQGVKPSLELTLSEEAAGGAEEGYELHIDADGAKLTAKTEAGLFYGVQTLKQLVLQQHAGGVIPAASIKDHPRFSWRGLHLDVSRHFFTADEVKRLIDVMSKYKLNRFQWHLTDDQGWRLPVPGYPQLTERGAMDEAGHSKAYTKEDIQSVVSYARERYIEVIPEVDVPGHAAAAISAINNIGNDDMPDWSPPSQPPQNYGMLHYTLGRSEETKEFLKTVFATVSELFPSAWVHVGGDEAPNDQWNQSPKAKAEKGSFVHVQSLFNQDLTEILKNAGKTMVGWDEVLGMDAGSWPEGAVVMAWRSADELKKGVGRGFKCVNADQKAWYLDHKQSEGDEPCGQGGRAFLPDVYAYDPIPQGLPAEQEHLVLGGQAQLWSEYFPTWSNVEYMAYPRSLALAERLWSPSTTTDFDNFKSRLADRLEDFEKAGVIYRDDAGVKRRLLHDGKCP